MTMTAHVRSSPGNPLMPLVVAPDARIVQARRLAKAIVLGRRPVHRVGRSAGVDNVVS
jgi:hypothetical protein